MKLNSHIAMRFLLDRQSNRFVSLVAILAVGGIAVGVAALIVSLSIMNGFEHEVRSRIIGTTSHINVYSLRSESFENWKPLLDDLKKHPDVEAAAPFVYSKIPVAMDNKFDGMLLRGIIPEEETKLGNPENNLIDGEWLPDKPDTSQMPGLVLGNQLAHNIGAGTGDTVFIYGLGSKRAGRITPKINRFLVRGIFETGMYDFDAALGYTNLESAQRTFDLGSGITGIELKIDNYYEARKIAGRIEDYMRRKSHRFFYAISWDEMNKNLFSWMTLEKWGLFLLLTLIVAVAAFNIASTLIMVVMEKTSQIGVLRSVGATAGRIRKIFFIQGVTVGLLGTLLGLSIGFVLSFIQYKYQVISLPGDIYTISSLPVKMQILDFVAIGLAAIAITLISSIYPAWRAAKYTPIDAIRRSGV